MQNFVEGIAATEAIREPDLRGPEVGPVEHDHLVGMRKRHVHRRYAGVFD
jgi:hypothetical protein